MSDAAVKHYGIKGMRWGVRNVEKRPASEESIRTKSIKAERKISGIKALTNKELKDAIERMNLEKQYISLAPTGSDVARQFIRDFVKIQGKQEANKAVLNQFKTSTANK